MAANGTPQGSSSPDFLDGWKEISAYLGRDTRTCQRWEQEFGLPVYRIDPQSPRAKVHAFRSELDVWRKTRYKAAAEAAAAKSRRAARFAAFASLAVLAVLLLALFVAGRRDADPTQFTVAGSDLVFMDLKGRVLWTKPVRNPNDLKPVYLQAPPETDGGDPSRPTPHLVHFQDVDHDGKNEVLAFLDHENPADRCVAFYDHDGRLIWEKRFTFPYVHGEGPLVQDYLVRSLQFEDIDGDGRPEILVLWGHVKRFPSTFLAYDLEGRELISYSHTGQLQFFKMAATGAGERIFLGGTNNLLGCDAVLAALDGKKRTHGLGPPYEIPADLDGDQAALEKYIPRDPERASQEFYLRFRRHKYAAALETRILNVTNVLADERNMEVAVNFLNAYPILVSFGPRRNLRSLVPGVDFLRTYERLESQGRAPAPLADFLWECERGISVWDGSGWRPITRSAD